MLRSGYGGGRGLVVGKTSVDVIVFLFHANVRVYRKNGRDVRRLRFLEFHGGHWELWGMRCVDVDGGEVGGHKGFSSSFRMLSRKLLKVSRVR